MTDDADLERLLRQAAPGGTPPELRARVLAAVAAELPSNEPASPSRLLRLAVAIAASVLAGFWLNGWVTDRLDDRLADILGPPPAQRQASYIANDIASISDHSTGRWVYHLLSVNHPDSDAALQYPMRLLRMIHQLIANLEETDNEALQKDPRMDRDLHGSRGRHPAARQHLLRLEYRNTA